MTTAVRASIWLTAAVVDEPLVVSENPRIPCDAALAALLSDRVLLVAEDVTDIVLNLKAIV